MHATCYKANHNLYILPTEETPDDHRGQGPAQRGLEVDASGA